MRDQEELRTMRTDSKTAFQLGAESLGKAFHPRRHTGSVGRNIDDARAFLDAFNLSLARSAVLLGAAASEEFAGLVDEARFSDPMSNDACRDTESVLEDLATKIETAAAAGTCDDELVSKAHKYLSVRNKICQQGK